MGRLPYMLKAPEATLHSQEDTFPNIAGYMYRRTFEDTFTWQVKN